MSVVRVWYIAVAGSFEANDVRTKALFAFADHYFFMPVDWKRIMAVLSAINELR